MPDGVPRRDTDDFSVVLGGPLYRLYLRTRLVRPPLELLYRRIAALALVAWLPLLVLTAVAETVTHGVGTPFLYDFDVHVRLLVSLPLLVGAELFVHRTLSETVLQFVDRELIVAADRERFERSIARAMRLRDSAPLELVVLALAVFAGDWVWKQHLSDNVDTWYATGTAAGVRLTTAGLWYAFVSLPLFDFLLLRWYFRLALWYRFLWIASRFDLQLNALHPDRAGGIGFLGQSVFAFAPVLVAHTALASSLIGDRIVHAGASLPDFKLEIIGIVVFLLLLSLAPLAFFLGPMSRAKQAGRREYGTQASRYVNEFRRKWLAGRGNTGEPFLGSADIQSLADLAGGYDVVSEMRPFPIGRKSLVVFALIVVAPFAPLVLTMVPLEEMLSRLMKFVL